jgi:hypothetical protein
MFASPLHAVFGTSFFLVPFLLAAWLQRDGGSYREALVRGWLWTFGIALLLTELASPFKLILPVPFQIVWIGLVIALAAGLHRTGRPLFPKWRWPDNWIDRLILAVIAAIMFTTLVSALTSAPNNYDSMTYRLPRVEHFAQNASLAIYPTGIARQAALSPFGEIVLLQIRLLTGGDGYFQLMQWFAAIGSMVAASATVANLGGGHRAQMLAAVAVIGVPMVVLQSSSTQVDVLVGFLVIIMIERLTSWRNSRNQLTVAEMGLAAGLGVLTKGTALLVGLPFGLWFAWEAALMLRDPTTRIRAVRAVLLAGVIPTLLSAPFLIRQYSDFRGGMGLVSGWVLSGSFGPAQTVDNVARHYLLNLKFISPAFDAAADDLVEGLERITGADRFLADTTHAGQVFRVKDMPDWFWQNEDFATAPVMSLAILLSIIAVLVRRGELRRRWLALALATLGGTVLLSIGLRWQIWGTRLHVPALVAAAPLVALVLEGMCIRLVQAGFAALALGLSLLTAVSNMTRPPFGENASIFRTRTQSLIYNYRAVEPDFVRITDLIAELKLNAVGVASLENGFEYPIWALLRDKMAVMPRIEHIAPIPQLAALPYPLGPFQPQAIVTVDSFDSEKPVVAAGGWSLIVQGDVLRLYVRSDIAVPDSLRQAGASSGSGTGIGQSGRQGPTPPDWLRQSRTLTAASVPGLSLTLDGRVVQVLKNGAPVGGAAFALGDGFRLAAFADIDADGQPEALMIRPGSGETDPGAVYVRTVTGNGKVGDERKLADLRVSGWRIAGTGRIDNRCGEDVLLENSDSGRKVIWLDTDCNGAIDRHLTVNGLPGSNRQLLVGISDFDRDRNSELLLWDADQRTLTAYEVVAVDPTSATVKVMASFPGYPELADLVLSLGSPLVNFGVIDP